MVADQTPYILGIIAFAAVIHSGFSLGASMMALLSGHSLSRKRSHARLLSLTGSFVVGSFAMVLLLALAITYAIMLPFGLAYPILHLALATMTVLSGLWVLFFYYRRGYEGTALWLPRSFARYLTDRSAHTKSPSEAFVLGAASVVYELPVTIWLILIAATNVVSLYPTVQTAVLTGYALIAILTLVIVFILTGGGHTGAALSRFRTRHKRFLQIIIGTSMIVLGVMLFLNEYSMILGARGQWPW